MKELYKNLKPERVFYYFEKISDIPRGSGNTQGMTDYLVAFAEEKGLKYSVDELGNVVISKDAYAGRENDDVVILQGHVDMVCEKTDDSNHDFTKDGLDLLIDGDYLYANKTTLGGDDGIAVAYMLAILEGDYDAPGLECIFTVDEEVGLIGAQGLDISNLKGKYLINLDSEEDGKIWVGCAGGMTISNDLDVEMVSVDGIEATITLSGLCGGHSGSEIDKGRMNATITLARVLNDLSYEYDVKVASLKGGNKDNVIPLFATASIICNIDDLNDIENFISEYESMLKNEACDDDSNLSLKFEYEMNVVRDVLAPMDLRKVLFLLNLLPNGVAAMSNDIAGLVETSSNLGIFSLEGGQLHMEVSVRSSVYSKKIMIANKIIMLCEMMNGRIDVSGDYPAWQYKKDSKLRELMIDVYEDMFNVKPEAVVIHAGLECGYFADLRPDLDIVSIGPDMRDIHTAKERLSISSTEKTFNYLVEVLKKLK